MRRAYAAHELRAARYYGDTLEMSSDAGGGARDVAIALSTASSRQSLCHAGKHNMSRRPNWEATSRDVSQVEGPRLISKLIHQRGLSLSLEHLPAWGFWSRGTFHPPPLHPHPPMSANFLDNFSLSRYLSSTPVFSEIELHHFIRCGRRSGFSLLSDQKSCVDSRRLTSCE